MHEVARRWVGQGHKVTAFTARYRGCLDAEDVDGIQVIRRGNRATVYLLAWIYYVTCFRDKYDIIVEAKDGGFPWFSGRYARAPVVGLIHQTGRSFYGLNVRESTWFYEAPYVLATLACLIEPLLLRAYRDIPIVTVSESTANDLIALGLPTWNIHIVHGGTTLSLRNTPEREPVATLMYVGRLKKSKRVHDIVSATALARKSVPDVKLWIIGEGDNGYVTKLKTLVKLLDLESNVKFYGRVSDAEKASLLKRAHVIVVASIREGWGLVVTEAGASGVPAVGYDVPGVKDSIKHGETGLLANSGDVKALAEALVQVLSNPQLWRELSSNAIEFTKNLTWDETANEFMRVLAQISDRTTPRESFRS